MQGLPTKLLKSALQKFVRRRETALAQSVLHLLDSCGTHESGSGKMATAAKSMRTNVMNRLVVMMSEEVNVHEARLPVLMRQKYEVR